MTNTYSIDSVWITLTYPNEIAENFHLRKPHVFEFGFKRIPRRADYRDAFKRYQKGNYYYQLIANYSYEWHEMDLRKLLVAKEIELKFPPAFGQLENYNSAKVLLDNESVPRNWFQGLVVGSDSGEIVPQGAINLRFVGVDAYTEAQTISLFGWNQSDVADPDDEDGVDPGDDPETSFSGDTYYLLGIEENSANATDKGRLRRIKFNENGDIQYESDFNFSSQSLYLNTDVQSRNLSVGKDGTVMVSTTDFSSNTHFVYVFDSDLNYKGRISFSAPENATGNRPQQAYFGEDSNIYIAESGANQIRIKKYDSNLNHFWTSEWFSTPDPNLSNAAPVGKAFVFFDGKAILWAGQVTNDHDTWLISVNPNNGSEINKVNITPVSQLRSGYPVVCRFSADNFIVGLHSGFFAVEQVKVYDKDLNEVRTVDQSSIGQLMITSSSSSSEARHSFIATLDDKVIIGNPRRDEIKCFDPMTDSLLWTTSLNNPIYRMSHVAGGKILTGAHEFSNDVPGIVLLDAATGTIQFNRGGSGDPIYNDLEIEPDRAAPAMRYEGWELDYFEEDPDTPPPPPPTPTYQGSIEVTGPADANFAGTAPEATIIIRNSPSQPSDTCGTGGTEFNIKYKGTDYCMVLPVASRENIALQIAQFISSSIPGLTATDGIAYDGDPAVFAKSETLGDADDGETITMGVPSVLEQNGPVFNRYVYHLSGGEPSSTIDEPVDVLLGKTVFATTANVTGSETAASIAQKVFDAMDAIDTNDVSVSKTGDRIDITCEGFKLAIALDIGTTGFDYTITQMTEV